jgi:hypothetical protein
MKMGQFCLCSGGQVCPFLVACAGSPILFFLFFSFFLFFFLFFYLALLLWLVDRLHGKTNHGWVGLILWLTELYTKIIGEQAVVFLVSFLSNIL